MGYSMRVSSSLIEYPINNKKNEKTTNLFVDIPIVKIFLNLS